ncbi:pectate lyase [Marinobacter halodurans]|uniref:pectin lyase n=1 Tax=Marinobacter halodurans TaxID=2528979 RepID=A0ABY1ZPE0_9GAMM|nr:RICIN domain-containing protein [Marinobacter halodurans]TBW58461.1 pectate lyase [Marinobacter halodurans]
MRITAARKTSLAHRARLLATAAGLLLSGLAQANNCTEMPTNDNVYNIVNESTGRYMDVANDSRENGAIINLWQKNGRTNQQFKVSSIGNGYWVIHPTNGDARKSLDVAGRSTDDGARILQWDYWGGDNQQWKFIQADNGSIKIQSRRSGKLVTVAQDVNGAKVYQRGALPDGKASLQSWYFNPVNGSCGGDKGGESGPIGFAEGTTGGGNASPELADTCDKLATALSSKGPKVIQVPDKTLDCHAPPRTVYACRFTCGNANGETNPDKEILWIPGSNTCASLFAGHSRNNPKARMFKDKQKTTLDNRIIRVGSNKTLVGLGANSKLEGVTLDLRHIENVIIRNLAIENVNPHVIEGYDAISMIDTKNVWVDHVETSMISDGHTDIYNSKNVTLSWNRFEGLNPHYCGGRDPYVGFAQNSEVTFHHNYWRYSNGRNPKISENSRAHIFNNLWKGITGHAIAVVHGSQVKSEGNYFADTHNPHWLVTKDSTTRIDSGKATNIYVDDFNGNPVPENNRISARDDTGPLNWSVPYIYKLQKAKDAAFDIVLEGTGPQ